MNRAAADAFGRTAELRAAWLLRLKGWRILGQRLRTPRGEIDILARRGRTLAFVEVKARSDNIALDLAIDRQRLKRVAAAAELLSSRHARPGDTLRIDVILVAPRRWPRHLANVWHG